MGKRKPPTVVEKGLILMKKKVETFIVRRGHFVFKAFVHAEEVVRADGRVIRPSVRVELEYYKGQNTLIREALGGSWLKKISKRATLHPNDPAFSTSYGVNLAIDRLTREICGLITIKLVKLVQECDEQLRTLANATVKSKRRFIRNYTDSKCIERRMKKYGKPDPAGMVEVVKLTNTTPVKTTDFASLFVK